MAGDTTQLYRLSVEFQDLPINRQFTEAKLMFEGLQDFALPGECCAKGIEIRCLCRPETGFKNCQVGSISRRHLIPLGIEDFMHDFHTFACTFHFRIYHDLTRVACPNRQVGEMCLGYRHKGYITEDAIGSPVVVIVEVTAPKLGDDAQGQLLFALSFQIVGDIEDSGIIARTPRADFLAVDPKVVAIEHTVETNGYALSSPCGWHGERCPIVARHGLGAVIAGFTESVGLPAARHGYLAPGGIGLGHSSVVCNPIYHLQTPLAVERTLHGWIGYRQNALKGIRHLGTEPQGKHGGAQHACHSSHHSFLYLRSIFVY